MINYQNENILYQILDGRVKCKIGDKLVYIEKPRISSLLLANDVYDRGYALAVENGAYTESEIVGLLKIHGDWSDLEEKRISVIDKDIEHLKLDLYEAYTGFKGRDRIRKDLEKTKQERIKLFIKKSVMDSWTAEYFASTQRMMYLMWCSTKHKNKRFFRGAFIQSDFWCLSRILTIYNNSLLSDVQIRELCKMPKWRTIWALSKTPNSIFRKPITELTDNQLSLISWSKFYDGVQKSMDAPSDEVMNDDDLLDGWAIWMSRKREDERKRSLAEQSTKDMHPNASEVFVITDNREDAVRINSLNDQYGRIIQKQKLTQAEKHGHISDFKMPCVQQELQMQMNQMKIPGG